MKTPIQDLIDYCVRNRFNCTQEDGFKFEALDYDDLRAEFDAYKQKEKAFAFDCFEAGCTYEYARTAYMDYSSKEFEQFYSQYVAQHKQ